MQLLGSPTVVLDCLRRCGLLRSVCVPILALVTGHKLAERAVIARSQEQYAVRRVSRGPQENFQVFHAKEGVKMDQLVPDRAE